MSRKSSGYATSLVNLYHAMYIGPRRASSAAWAACGHLTVPKRWYATQHGCCSAARYRTSGGGDPGGLVRHGMGVGLGRAHSLEYLCSHGVHRPTQPFRIADDVARGNVATEPVV